MTQEFVVRYATTDGSGKPALIVTDRQGNAYLYAAGALQLRAAGDETGERMLGRLGTPERWESRPVTGVYSLDALQRLAADFPAERPACS